MDLESARRVANLEAANPGFKYQLVKWTVVGSNTSPSMTPCHLTLPRVGFFRAQGYFKVTSSTGNKEDQGQPVKQNTTGGLR